MNLYSIVGFLYQGKTLTLVFFNIENESNENFLRDGRIQVHLFIFFNFLIYFQDWF